jgi:hypothetical protein
VLLLALARACFRNHFDDSRMKYQEEQCETAVLKNSNRFIA